MNIKDYIEFLKITTLFKSFSSEELLSLFNINNHKIKQYKRKSIIHFESEKCSTLDIVLKGEILIHRIDEKGNILTITQFTVGDIIGGNLLFSNHTSYPMSIIAKSDTIVLHLQRDFILNLCQNHKDFLIEFLRCISDKTLILTNKIKSISIKSLRESIIDFLNYEYYCHKNTKIELTITKKELAERLGVQRTSLSRELNKMRKDNLIIFDANSITIKDLSIIKELL